MSFANIVNVVPLAREGKLRALAITSIKRSALASPDLPTMAELGFAGRPPISSLSAARRDGRAWKRTVGATAVKRINWACR